MVPPLPHKVSPSPSLMPIPLGHPAVSSQPASSHCSFWPFYCRCPILYPSLYLLWTVSLCICLVTATRNFTRCYSLGNSRWISSLGLCLWNQDAAVPGAARRAPLPCSFFLHPSSAQQGCVVHQGAP